MNFPVKVFVSLCITASLPCAVVSRLRAQERPGGAESGPHDNDALASELYQMQQQIDQLKAEVEELKQERASANIAPPAPATASARAAAATAVPPAGSATAQNQVAAASVTAAGAASAPANSTPAQPGLFSSTQISGFVDTYYGYDFNEPANRTAALHVFDGPTNQFGLNLAELTFTRNPAATNAESRLGYDLVFGYGNAINVVNASDPGGVDFARNVVQAYGSYLFPIGMGLQVDVGKFVTPAGAEVIESVNDWNYTRGFLLGYAIPFYHFGVRAKYAFNDKVSLTGYLVNGWNNVIDNNTGKTYGFSLAWTPDKKWSLAQNYLAGPEMAGTDRHWRQLTDTVIQYNATPKLSLLLNYDWSGGDLMPGRINPVFWTGAAGYVRYAFNSQNALTTRYEYYDDHDGFTTSTPQSLNEFTETYEHIFGGHLVTRVEYRRDVSNHPVFMKGTGFVDNQNTVTGGMIFNFDVHKAQ
ncbi:MAG: outer membrane beta-barrel protein [Terriglobia bacterium]